MSGEINIALSIRVLKDYLNYTFSPTQLVEDLQTARRGGHCQTIGTTAEAIDMGDIVEPSFCLIRNLDDAHYVTIGPQSASTGSLEPWLRLYPGQVALQWLDPACIPMAVADTHAVDVQFDIFEK